MSGVNPNPGAGASGARPAAGGAALAGSHDDLRRIKERCTKTDPYEFMGCDRNTTPEQLNDVLGRVWEEVQSARDQDFEWYSSKNISSMFDRQKAVLTHLVNERQEISKEIEKLEEAFSSKDPEKIVKALNLSTEKTINPKAIRDAATDAKKLVEEAYREHRLMDGDRYRKLVSALDDLTKDPKSREIWAHATSAGADTDIAVIGERREFDGKVGKSGRYYAWRGVELGAWGIQLAAGAGMFVLGYSLPVVLELLLPGSYYAAGIGALFGNIGIAANLFCGALDYFSPNTIRKYLGDILPSMSKRLNAESVKTSNMIMAMVDEMFPPGAERSKLTDEEYRRLVQRQRILDKAVNSLLGLSDRKVTEQDYIDDNEFNYIQSVLGGRGIKVSSREDLKPIPEVHHKRGLKHWAQTPATDLGRHLNNLCKAYLDSSRLGFTWSDMAILEQRTAARQVASELSPLVDPRMGLEARIYERSYLLADQVHTAFDVVNLKTPVRKLREWMSPNRN
ncbi:MAG: hypothetical protein DCC75_11590 [Proteobacteria bacterium]|nr:MAG: hypothetical protein DCC75_11590 [Pseudomonadota bacterium]